MLITVTSAATSSCASVPARYAQVIYLTAPAARPVVTRAEAGLPAGHVARVVVRDLPPSAFTPEATS